MSYLILDGENIIDVDRLSGNVKLTDEQIKIISKSRYGHSQFKYINGELVQDDEFVRNTDISNKRLRASLSPMKFNLALLNAGYLDDVENIISDVNTPREIKIMWNKATSFDRMNPTLIQMARSMNITDDQLDSIFGIIE